MKSVINIIVVVLAFAWISVGYADKGVARPSPESVMTLLFDGDPPKKYKIQDVATFEGELHLNKHNPEEFIYVLKHVKEID